MPVNNLYQGQCLEALTKLLEYFNDNQAELARYTGASYSTVVAWKKRGYIGKSWAAKLDEDQRVPFTKEQLRPDVKVWQ